MEEETRTGSADSENSSDNSYVKVSRDEVQHVEEEPDVPSSEPSPEVASIPAGNEDEDIYSGEDDQTTTTATSPQTSTFDPSSDPYYMESPEQEETQSPSYETTPISSTRVEDVPSSETTVKKSQPGLPQAKGYLSFLNALHPFVLYIIYWKDFKISAVVAGVCFVILLTLSLNTFIHTLVLLLLSFMVVSLTYIVSKVAIDSFYNREVKNPFSNYINQPFSLPEDKIVEWAKYFIKMMECEFNCLLRLLLFHKIKPSLMFGVALWLVSFITNCVTVLCALFIGIGILFTVPPIYDKYQVVIDQHVEQALKKGVETFKMVKSRIPYIGKAKED